MRSLDVCLFTWIWMTVLQPTRKLFCGKGLGADNISKSMKSDCVTVHHYRLPLDETFSLYLYSSSFSLQTIKQITLWKDRLKTIKFCFHRILIFNCSFAYEPVVNYSLNCNRPFQGKRSVCLNLCFVAQVKNVICHVVEYVACRPISSNHKRRFSVRGVRSANSQLFGTFPYDLGKMSSSFLPSTTTEIIVFVFAIPATRGNHDTSNVKQTEIKRLFSFK